MTEQQFISKIHKLNGKVYLVGGYVRDLYMNQPANDKDYVICHIDENNFKKEFPKANKVGNSFPVYLLNIDGQDCEIAFARKDRKQGTGYKGFTTISTKDISIKDDLYRRDLTVNALALELPDRILIDLFNGLSDIKNHNIKHVSNHFKEDPVRSLRAARFASIWNFDIDKSTIELMKECKDDLIKEPTERLLKELIKVLTKSSKPSIFFKSLQKANLLDITFPEFTWENINLLDQIHTDKLIVKFLILTLNSELTNRIVYPADWIKAKHFIEYYLKENLTDSKLIKAIFTIQQLKINYCDWQLIYYAKFNKPLKILSYIDSLMPILQSVKGESAPNNLKNIEIGKWILNERIKLLNEFIIKKVF